LSNSNAITKLTILWAFSESALGGLLHALRIPLTGLFVGGSAVIFISLIAYYSENKSSILKATLLVLIIKFIVAPYTPLPAYFSVFMEGLVGFLLFNILNLRKTAPILLGFLTLTFSAFQKIAIYTIMFGMTFWESIDIFIKFVLNQFFISSNLNISFSYLIILVYVFIHILGGISSGIIAIRIPKWVTNFAHDIDLSQIVPESTSETVKLKRKSKKWYSKLSGILFFSLALFLIVLSYTTSSLESNLPTKITIMVVRSISITLIWFLLIAPYTIKFLQRILNRKKNEYATEVENIFNLLPEMKALVKFSWEKSKVKTGYGRIKLFLSYVFVIILIE